MPYRLQRGRSVELAHRELVNRRKLALSTRVSILDLSAIHPVLAKRKVDAPWLSAMIAVAESLSGKLAERATTRGAQKLATTAMHDAVSAQKEICGACYRLLAAVGSEDAHVARLLTEAARKRWKTKKEKTQDT